MGGGARLQATRFWRVNYQAPEAPQVRLPVQNCRSLGVHNPFLNQALLGQVLGRRSITMQPLRTPQHQTSDPGSSIFLRCQCRPADASCAGNDRRHTSFEAVAKTDEFPPLVGASPQHPSRNNCIDWSRTCCRHVSSSYIRDTISESNTRALTAPSYVDEMTTRRPTTYTLGELPVTTSGSSQGF